MKAVFVGGGSLRLLGILRGALAEPKIFHRGEINLYDLDDKRAEAMARMIMKTPEYATCRCKLIWGTTLDEALDGADMVGVILMAGSALSFERGNQACYSHGFIPSDNVSPNGAFLAMKGAPILLDLARRMTRLCPTALLVNFANPVAVLSGMINNHTPIKSVGVCAGYTNHQWDLSRLFGKDEQGTEFDVETAGINHLSFIVKGKRNGKDLFPALDRRLKNGWQPPRLKTTWSKAYRRSIPQGLKTLVRFYRELGALIFSTEGDGMMHLNYDHVLKQRLKTFQADSPAQLKRKLHSRQSERLEIDRRFQSFLSQELDQHFWDHGWRTPGLEWAQRQDRDIFVEVLRGLAGIRKVKVVTSRPNNGAVKGFTNRTVLEYSQTIEKGKIRPAGVYTVPAVAKDLISNLATHQTMLGDALATDDPRLLAQALLAYPVQPFSIRARKLYKQLLKINHAELPVGVRSAGEFL
jgi:alpha-galactosidase/6-phospho-beta-glucosidase family protein